MSEITLVSIVAALALVATSGGCLANDSTTQKNEATKNGATEPDGLAVWPRARFLASELQELRLGDLEVEALFCGCYDKPNKHFPYAIVLLKTSKGDLVTRPQRLERAVAYTPVAGRRCNPSCGVDADGPCYRSFPHPRDFPAPIYSRALAPFFPTLHAPRPSPFP